MGESRGRWGATRDKAGNVSTAWYIDDVRFAGLCRPKPESWARVRATGGHPTQTRGSVGGARAKSTPGSGVRATPIRGSPRSPVALIVLIEVFCVTWLVTANVVERPSPSDIGRFTLLAIVAPVYGEAGDRIEGLRRYVTNTTFINPSSLWCLTAAGPLPNACAPASCN